MKTRIAMLSLGLALIGTLALAEGENMPKVEDIKGDVQKLKVDEAKKESLKKELADKRMQRDQSQQKVMAEKEKLRNDIKAGASKDVIAADRKEVQETKEARNKAQNEVKEKRQALNRERAEIHGDKKEIRNERHERRERRERK